MAPVLILMGSQSDWPVMQKAAEMLESLNVKWQAKVVSAHRTPDLLKSTMEQAEQDGVPVVIAGAGYNHRHSVLLGLFHRRLK